MADLSITPQFPLRPLSEADGEAQSQVFRSAAEQSESAEPSRARTGVESGAHSVERRLYEAGGRPVRLGRYDVLRCIGAGGMGVVFEAADAETGQRVALKTCRARTPLGLARLKSEFRSLSGVAHPNLVRMIELGVDAGEWFVAMELVEGERFVDWVRADGATFQEVRLHAGLAQLASALAALHARGKLHRDVNAGNVLVTPAGRVVLLDFGLVRDHALQAPAPAPDGGASGTPGYVAPEQAAGGRGSPASDWYAFGVVLFQALTGQLPFSGSAARVLANKRALDAPSASSLARGVPPDLEALSAALLRRDPAARPTGEEVLRTLGAPPAAALAPASASVAGVTSARGDAPLEALRAAYRDAAAGAVVAVVHGPSGSGKTTLVARFLHELARRDAPPLVLRARCRPRESIPHRLLDGVVDALAAHLASLPERERAALLPPGMEDLAACFPVLEALFEADEAPPSPVSPFALLASLLVRVGHGARRMVVVAIDDAHAGTAEDGEHLAELAAPGIFVVLTHASEELASSPALAELGRALVANGEASLRHVVLDARHGGGAADEAAIAALPEPERRLLDVVASAPLVVDRALLFAVAGAGPDPELALLELESKRLVRVRGAGSGDAVLLGDERLRPIVAAAISAERARAIQRALARALAEREGADALEVAGCYARGGSPEIAAEHLDRVASHAVGAGAPELAVRLWGAALALTPDGTPEARAYAVWYAEALAASGRSVAAASAYLADLAGASVAEKLDRRLRAAEHLLVAGHVDEGLAALLPVLNAYGIRWPSSPRRALFSLALGLAPILLAGVDLERSASPRGAGAEEDRFARARVETLWLAARGLSLLDPMRAALFVLEALAAARRAGDGEHAALALAFLGSMLVYRGSAAEAARGNALLEEAGRYAHTCGDNYVLGFVWFCSGLARLCVGRYREALARVDDGLTLLMERNARLAWERNAHRAISLQILFELGALAERARRAEAWLTEARSHDDRTGEAQAALAVAYSILASGEPARARVWLSGALDLTWSGGFGLPHHQALWFDVSSLLYEGDAARARARLCEAWPKMAEAQLLHIQLVRVAMKKLRGITAVAVGGSALARAEEDAASLARERRPHALAASAVLSAGVAAGRSRIAEAAARLEAAARTYASAEMRVHAATCTRARGALLGGAEGRRLVEEADRTLSAEGVVDGARWTAMYTGIGVRRRA